MTEFLKWTGKAIAAAGRAGWSLGSAVSDGIAHRRANAAVEPSARAQRTGILAPGDGPPTGAVGAFQDFREVLLPRDVKALSSGAFPIGRVVHPHAEGRGEFPVFLDWNEVRRHVAVIGPAGSGKTANVIVPWVLGAAAIGMTCVVVDTKGTLRQEITDHKARHHIPGRFPITRWDIAEPAASRSWNPLGEITSSQDAAQVALAFLGAVDPRDPQVQFAERDHRWLRGLVHLLVTVRGANAHPQDLYALVVHQPTLRALAQQAPQAASDVIDMVNFPPGDFQKATWALANRLSWLGDPALAAMLSGTGPRSFSLSSALATGGIILVGARVSGGERTMTAAALMLNMLKIKCMGQFSNPNPMLWVMDEASKYAKRIELNEILDFMRGAGVAACVGLQDVTQFGDENEQERMLANADTMITMRGVSAATATFLSRRLGDVKAPIVTRTLQDKGRWAPSVSYETKPLLGTREIMQPPVGHYGAIVHVRGSSPYPFLVTFDH
jgi:type IV secretory pathway TraG/TraD family ATPase VirD4